MDSLQDIIKRYGRPEQPEIIALKRYVSDRYHTAISVAKQGEASIIITVPSAALANTLRLNIVNLKKECKIDKRIIFRIG